jgi:hypothetical protein
MKNLIIPKVAIGEWNWLHKEEQSITWFEGSLNVANWISGDKKWTIIGMSFPLWISNHCEQFANNVILISIVNNAIQWWNDQLQWSYQLNSAIQSRNDQFNAKLQHATSDHDTLSRKHNQVMEDIVCRSNELIQLKAQCTKL